MSEPFDYDELAAAGDDARKRKREDAMFPPRFVIRIRWLQAGTHIHCRLFTAPSANSVFSKCGSFVFDECEWPTVKAAFNLIAEVLPERE